ncbi:hypothetical protein [Phaeovulum vinaykumarii]|uniref:Uncharacterized protein n=1 Tax=Phaeovulum vinaykumarii TaxID=407234 RepID=A0A1N7JP02_9RHOB|nr:hypothetical protein [Phaeovulum vinaykumarii]SIS51093.1 hypothetical protein SAMN05421795_101207 [Phaeovulum vinaykumarii]SOB90566.1 hypothetical protein SAMN05878426_101207 [Phaeovulum vinaykumarii]
MKNAAKESFRRGFAAGFSAPYQLMYGRRTKIVTHSRDLVSLAWEGVGRAVSGAMDPEGERVGKASGSPSRARRGD